MTARARKRVLFTATISCITVGTLAGRIVTLVQLGIGVAQLDGNVALELVLKPDGVRTGYGLHNGGFAVGDVTDGTYDA